MKSFDYEAYAVDGAVYCVGCLPDGIDPNSEEVGPIFADSEWDHYPTCDACGAEHDYVSLTTYGAVSAAPYSLTLTDDEVKALEWIGNRYAHGDDLLRILNRAPSRREGRNGTTYGLSESAAWEVQGIGEDCEYRWDCLAAALAAKLSALCDSIV